MFDYTLKYKSQRRCLVGPRKTNFSKRFEVTPTGVNLSDDFRAVASDFIDYSMDNLVKSGAPVSDGPSFNDVSITSLDDVESASSKILEANDFIIHDDKSNK